MFLFFGIEDLHSNGQCHFGWVLIGVVSLYSRVEGYPFAYKIFWNGAQLDKWQFGGNGQLTIDLLTKKSGTVMFDPCDEEVIRLQKENKVDQSPGFYISQKFFSMVHQNMFDKYLYNENQ